MKKLIIYFLLLISVNCFSQHSGLDLLGDKKEIELKFRFENGLIILPIHYNNFLPLNFIFDTGAEHTILFRKELNDFMGIPYERRIGIRGADLQDSMFALITRNVPIIVNNNIRVSRDIIVLEEDRLNLEERTGFQVDGILGASFFKNLVITINFKKKKIKLHNPNTFEHKKLKDYEKIPIIKVGNKPYLISNTFSNGINKRQLLLLDSGSSLAFLLHYEADSSIILPEKIITGKLGVGLGGNLEGFIGRVDKLKLDKYSFDNVITHFQKIPQNNFDSTDIVRTGLIGTPILSRFDICIDYLREDLYLKPNKDYNKEFKYDRSGLSLIAYGHNFNKFYVKEVRENSPAFEAGIQKGDLITRIGLWSSKWYSLEKITNKLKGNEGKTIKLTLDRNGKKMKVKFKLRDLFVKMIRK